MGIRTRWMALGRWLAPGSQRLLTNVAVVAIYVLMMLALLIMPASLFLVITHHAGANVHGSLQLTAAGYWLLYATLGLTFLWSIVTGGFARAFLRPRHLDWPWLMLLGLGLLVGLTKLGDGAREAISQLHPDAGTDNGEAIAFFAFWLLMIGYAGKAVWDEARDRVTAIVEREIAKEPQPRFRRRTAAETTDE